MRLEWRRRGLVRRAIARCRRLHQLSGCECNGDLSPAKPGDNIPLVQRGSITVASFTVLVCFVATAFTPTMMAQSIGPRQPDVADWRLFHRNNDEYWARMVTATTGWWDPALNRSKVRLSASDVRHLRLLAGIGDDEPSDPIVALIGRQMKLGQYLLVT